MDGADIAECGRTARSGLVESQNGLDTGSGVDVDLERIENAEKTFDPMERLKVEDNGLC